MNETPAAARPLNILAVFAHPDDEGFGAGGTLAMLVRRGHRVTLICATNGDVGEISDPQLATPDTLWQVRQEELRAAMQVTGISDLRFLNYRDSGMDGTADNDHPASLYQADPEQVIGRLLAVLQERQPDLVITHDPTGGYGHPDHITICRRTGAALERWTASGGQPPLLYYICFPKSFFQQTWQKMLELGIKPPFGSDDVADMGTPDDEVTTTKHIGEFLELKKESLACHRTQIDPHGAFSQLPPEFVDELMSTEYYALAPAPDGQPQTDLLAELR